MLNRRDMLATASAMALMGTTAARAQSADMIRRNFFDHVNPSGESPSERIGRMHRRLIGTAGENIWKGSGKAFVDDPNIAEAIVQSWMHSPHHRENILRPAFTSLGVGVAIQGGEIRATQNFSNVRAYLREPLPDRVASGNALSLIVEGIAPSPQLFDLWDERAQKSTGEPAPLSRTRLVAQPGSYRIRFYFPARGSNFDVFEGPQVRIE